MEGTKNRRYLANLRRAGVTSGKLLEVGVGTGAFLRESRGAGFEVEGCDLSSSLCSRVQEVTGIKVHNLPLHILPQAAYDVVVMHHVLEHVPDPVAFLRAARERLRPGGLLHVAVPNIACWEAAFPGWNSYMPYHLVYFSPGSLARMAVNAGVKDLEIRTHDTFASWFLTILRTVAGIRPRQDQKIAASLGRVPSWWQYVEPPYRLAMVVAGLLLWPVRWLQGRLGKGDELLMIATSTE